jgi:hypothetical protein
MLKMLYYQGIRKTMLCERDNKDASNIVVWVYPRNEYNSLSNIQHHPTITMLSRRGYTNEILLVNAAHRSAHKYILKNTTEVEMQPR